MPAAATACRGRASQYGSYRAPVGLASSPLWDPASWILGAWKTKQSGGWREGFRMGVVLGVGQSESGLRMGRARDEE